MKPMHSWLVTFLLLIGLRYVTLWSWHTTLNVRHVIKICIKFEQNRTIRAWVIDDLASLYRLFSLFFCVFIQYRPTIAQRDVDGTGTKPNLRTTCPVRRSLIQKLAVVDFTYLARNEGCCNASRGRKPRLLFALWAAAGRLGFDEKWNFKISSPTGSHIVPVCQLWWQSKHVRLSYW